MMFTSLKASAFEKQACKAIGFVLACSTTMTACSGNQSVHGSHVAGSTAQTVTLTSADLFAKLTDNGQLKPEVLEVLAKTGAMTPQEFFASVADQASMAPSSMAVDGVELKIDGPRLQRLQDGVPGLEGQFATIGDAWGPDFASSLNVASFQQALQSYKTSTSSALRLLDAIDNAAQSDWQSCIDDRNKKYKDGKILTGVGIATSLLFGIGIPLIVPGAVFWGMADNANCDSKKASQIANARAQQEVAHPNP